MKRTRYLVLISLLAASFVACSDSSDPTEDQEDGTSSLPDADSQEDDTTSDVVDTDDTDDADGSVLPDTADVTPDLDDADGNGPGDVSDADGSEPDVADTDDAGDSTVATCLEEDNFDYLGQFFDGDTDVPNGGCAVTSPVGGDTGLDDVVAATPDSGCDFDLGECESSVSITVTNAVVAATMFKTNNCDKSLVNFWVQDENGYMEVFLSEECAASAGDAIPAGLNLLRSGDRVSFTVTEVDRYFERGRIREITNFTRATDQGDEVYVETVDDTLTNADIGKVIYLEGVTVGSPSECGGGKQCYTIDYNDGDQIAYRTGDDAVPSGTTLQFLGALSEFQGLQIANTPNSGNYDWGRFVTE